MTVRNAISTALVVGTLWLVGAAMIFDDGGYTVPEVDPRAATAQKPDVSVIQVDKNDPPKPVEQEVKLRQRKPAGHPTAREEADLLITCYAERKDKPDYRDTKIKESYWDCHDTGEVSFDTDNGHLFAHTDVEGACDILMKQMAKDLTGCSKGDFHIGDGAEKALNARLTP